MFLCFGLNAQTPVLNAKMNDIYASFEKNKLVIGNSKVERSWQWTGKGIVTNSLKNIETKKEWCNKNMDQQADWSIPNQPNLTDAKLISLSAKESDDEGFTTRHMEVVAEIVYPEIKTGIKYLVWIYPEGSGIRTQLLVKSEQSFPKVWADNSGIPVSEIKILQASSVGSPETTPEMIFDHDSKTYWGTVVSKTKPLKPNFLILDLQKEHIVNGISITQRSDYEMLGWVEKFVVYASNDTTKWEVPVGNGELSRAEYPQYFKIPPKQARYIKIVIPPTTKVNGSDWQTTIGEIRIFSNQYPFKPVDEGRAEYFPINCSVYTRTNVGYNADQQFRNSLNYEFFKDQINKLPFDGTEMCKWSNILSLNDNSEGVAFVKESDKTALQQAYLTGGFICSKDGMEVTGWGLAPEDFTKEYRKCWANWTIVYNGGEEERELGIKVFDRLRFPGNLPGNKLIYGNSWGNGVSTEAPWREKMDGGLEPNVLDALKAAHEMGIESYLIDCGWTDAPDVPSQVYPFGRYPHKKYYPNGWETVKKAGIENGVKLSLWTDVGITPEELTWNQEHGNFVSWKWDFANLNSFKARNDIEIKARNFIRQFNHKVSLNWDLTECAPRYGLFWAREYGLIFLTNREPSAHILYTPSVALRDEWDLAKYLNTNQFQVTIRNVKNIMPGSDAHLYNQEYATAIGCVGIPLFFEKLVTYSAEDRQVIKGLLETYKNERDAMFDSYVFPIGDRPDNSSFTGFQFVNPESNSGHLLLFRELYSNQNEKEIKLSFLKNKRLKLIDLRNFTETIIQTDQVGFAKFKIINPADFAFYRYEIVK